MNKLKNIITLFAIGILCSMLLLLNFNNDKQIKSKIRIGVSDDTSGFVISYMMKKNNFKNVQINDLLDTYSMADC